MSIWGNVYPMQNTEYNWHWQNINVLVVSPVDIGKILVLSDRDDWEKDNVINKADALSFNVKYMEYLNSKVY